MALTNDQKYYIEARVANDKKSVAVAYLLWFFLGLFSAHRFYLGHIGSGIAQLILNFLIIGLIWTLIDVFLIPGMVKEDTNRLRNELVQNAMMA